MGLINIIVNDVRAVQGAGACWYTTLLRPARTLFCPPGPKEVSRHARLLHSRRKTSALHQSLSVPIQQCSYSGR